MSDSVSKWYEDREDLDLNRPYKPYTNKIINEGIRKQAYTILVEYPEEAILEAARIIRVGQQR